MVWAPQRLFQAAEQAGASQFDALLGTSFFRAWYGMSVDTYGAYPSLHVSYPFMATVVCWKVAALRRARFGAAAILALMCLSAVYLQHHYVIDVCLGLAYAIVTLTLVTLWQGGWTEEARA